MSTTPQNYIGPRRVQPQRAENPAPSVQGTLHPVMPELQREIVSVFRTPRRRFSVADVQNRVRVRQSYILSALLHELYDRQDAIDRTLTVRQLRGIAA